MRSIGTRRQSAGFLCNRVFTDAFDKMKSSSPFARPYSEGAVWHYTAGHKLPSIQQYGALVPTGVKLAPKEAPVLWFSADSVFEPTAIKLVKMPRSSQLVRPSKEELHAMVGLYRFRLPARDSRLLAWPQLIRAGRIAPEGVASMIRAGLELGAKPLNWYGVMTPISLPELQFEAWDGGTWRRAEINAEIENTAARSAVVRSVSAAEFGPQAIKGAWQAGIRTKQG